MPLVFIGLVMTVIAIYSTTVAIYFNGKLRASEAENIRLKALLDSKFD